DIPAARRRETPSPGRRRHGRGAHCGGNRRNPAECLPAPGGAARRRSRRARTPRARDSLSTGGSRRHRRLLADARRPAASPRAPRVPCVDGVPAGRTAPAPKPPSITSLMELAMDEPLNLMLFSGTDDKLQAAAVLTAGAAALGRPVNVFLQYWALDAFRRGHIERDHGLSPEAGGEGGEHVAHPRESGEIG